MIGLPLFAVAALLTTPSYAHASTSGPAIPPWARRYNVNCSHCHAAAIPRLNATGIRFKWAGYRMPEDLGTAVSVNNVSNYLAARALIQYTWQKTEGQPVSTSELSDPALMLMYAGPFGKNFGGWFELSREMGEVSSTAMLTGVWGNEKSHGGVRIGMGPMYLESGIAGFDRPIGIEAPTPAAAPVSAAIPFSFGGELKAAELFYVASQNRVAVQVLNSSVFSNGVLNQAGSTRKDVGVTEQLLLDEKGSGVYAAGYYGTVTALDNVQPDVRSHYWRLALSASKIIGSDSSNFEALGGVVYGKDIDLPLGAIYPLPNNKGYGYWFSGQYHFPKPALTLFSRYEFIDPDTRIADDGRRRFVLGAVLPVSLPEYLRLTAEYLLDIPQASGAPKQHSVAGEVQFVF